MATGFNTQTVNGEYRLQFETDNREHYLSMQEAARKCVDNNVPVSEPIRDCYWATEQAYKNGKEGMRQAILEKLQDAKHKTKGAQSAVLAEVIEMVKNLQVRP